MTTEEFSNTFDTLLNSYNIQAGFGEGVSKQGAITLDEYEKSVLLTQAQDAIVKSYFDRTYNNNGEGFDDSARRQVDFSSLIRVKTYHLGEVSEREDNNQNYIIDPNNVAGTAPSLALFRHDSTCYDDRGCKVTLPSNILFMLNEKLATLDGNTTKTYVVVPINYKEYDREMSKAYAQPLKKQAWRLFSNSTTGYDIDSEIVPIEGTLGEWLSTAIYVKNQGGVWQTVSMDSSTNIAGTAYGIPELPTGQEVTGIWQLYVQKPMNDVTYTIRYVQRPTPIILRDLPNNLTIDNISTETACTLNPILHMDILNRAFELAITTRGGGTAQQRQEDRSSNSRQNQ